MMTAEKGNHNASVICHLDQLQDFRSEWVEVFEDSAVKSPFLSFEYVNHWYSCFSAPDQVRVYRASAEGRTIGFLPLVKRKKMGIKVLASLTNAHCFHGAPLVRRGYEDISPGLILNELINGSERWDLFQFEGFSLSPESGGIFSDEALNRSSLVWKRKSYPSYIVLLPDSFDEYLRVTLSKKVRDNVTNHRNRLSRSGSVIFRHYCGTEATAHWDEFVKIENSGWKGKEGSSIARTDESFRQYYDGLVKLLADCGALRMFFLEVDSRPVAGAFGYTEGDVFHLFKSGYNEKYRAFSPSNLLRVLMIEHIINTLPHIKTYNMFPWDYGYKHWFSNSTKSWDQTVIYNKTARGIASCRYSDMKALVKRMIGKSSV